MEHGKIILVGGGGHARVLIELIKMTGAYEIEGILDPTFDAGYYIDGIKVLGDDDLLPGLFINGVKNATVGIGSIKDNSRKMRVYEMVTSAGFYIPSLVHPKAIVSPSDTVISRGVQIMAGAIVQRGSVIGENTIINTGAIIEHDCTIGRNVHICPGAVICGGTVIGDNSFIGAGATVIQYLEIGNDTIIGAGSVIRKNLMEGMMVRGVCSE